MTIYEFFAGGGVAVVLFTLMQVAPININPWSALARALGRGINGEVLHKVDSLSADVQSLRSETEEREAKAARARILRFGDEIYKDTRHSKEHFDQILDDITDYEQYCAAHPKFKNNMTALTVSRIKEIYQKCLENHSFL